MDAGSLFNKGCFESTLKKPSRFYKKKKKKNPVSNATRLPL